MTGKTKGPTNISILIPCHNRPLELEKTLKALEAWKEGREKVVLLDSSSNQSSREVAQKTWRGEIETLKLPETTYWAESIEIGWAHETECDFLLWVNEDTSITGPLKTLYVENQITTSPIHSIEDKTLVGGGRLQDEKNPLRFHLSKPGTTSDTCDGNLVSIPKTIRKKIGFPTGYRHAFADWDFGLQCTRKGIPVRIQGATGMCSKPGQNQWRREKSMKKRVVCGLGPTGLYPKDWGRFCAKYGGKLKWLRFLYGYRHLLFAQVG